MAEVLIDYLLKRNEVNCLLKHLSHHFSKYKNHIIVASALIAEAKSLVSKKVRCTAEHLDINDKEMLRKFVKLADVVVGYVPP
jgi:short-subunit dehydrogenase involved in D-alanine esterification of teichoic acids